MCSGALVVSRSNSCDYARVDALQQTARLAIVYHRHGPDWVVEFVPGPGAELDLFVKGNLFLTGKMSFGDKARPAATRIYVGGSGGTKRNSHTSATESSTKASAPRQTRRQSRRRIRRSARLTMSRYP